MGVHVHVGAVEYGRPMVHVAVPVLYVQNWYSTVPEPPEGVAVHVTGVPAGSGNLGVEASCTPSGCGGFTTTLTLCQPS
jgi:hypothetical protein